MQTERKITEKDLELILELKNKGWSFVKLARKYKCHHSSIFYWFKKLGIDWRKGLIKIKKQKFKKQKKEPKPAPGKKPVKMYRDYLADEQWRTQDAITRARNRIVDKNAGNTHK